MLHKSETVEIEYFTSFYNTGKKLVKAEKKATMRCIEGKSREKLHQKNDFAAKQKSLVMAMLWCRGRTVDQRLFLFTKIIS